MPGHIDKITNLGMTGWASSMDRRRACRIRLDLDGVPTYWFVPREYRKDLVAAGGYCSLTVKFAMPLAQSKSVSVDVWNEETGERLTMPGLIIEPDNAGVKETIAAGMTTRVQVDAVSANYAVKPKVEGWEAALANVLRLATEQIAALEQEADAAHAEVRWLRAATTAGSGPV